MFVIAVCFITACKKEFDTSSQINSLKDVQRTSTDVNRSSNGQLIFNGSTIYNRNGIMKFESKEQVKKYIQYLTDVTKQDPNVSYANDTLRPDLDDILQVYEDQLNFNSLRNYYLTEENILAQSENLTEQTQPDKNDFIKDPIVRSVLNTDKMIIVGDSVFDILDDHRTVQVHISKLDALISANNNVYSADFMNAVGYNNIHIEDANSQVYGDIKTTLSGIYEPFITVEATLDNSCIFPFKRNLGGNLVLIESFFDPVPQFNASFEWYIDGVFIGTTQNELTSYGWVQDFIEHDFGAPGTYEVKARCFDDFGVFTADKVVNVIIIASSCQKHTGYRTKDVSVYSGSYRLRCENWSYNTTLFGHKVAAQSTLYKTGSGKRKADWMQAIVNGSVTLTPSTTCSTNSSQNEADVCTSCKSVEANDGVGSWFTVALVNDIVSHHDATKGSHTFHYNMSLKSACE